MVERVREVVDEMGNPELQANLTRILGVFERATRFLVDDSGIFVVEKLQRDAFNFVTRIA